MHEPTPEENRENTKRFNFEERRSEFMCNFKSELNNFMYKWVPGQTTIDEFENLTCSIHELVYKEWEKYV